MEATDKVRSLEKEIVSFRESLNLTEKLKEVTPVHLLNKNINHEDGQYLIDVILKRMKMLI